MTGVLLSKGNLDAVVEETGDREKGRDWVMPASHQNATDFRKGMLLLTP